MRQLFGVGLAVAVFALVAGCGKKSTTADGGGGGGGSTSIEGTWVLVGMEKGGKSAPEEMFSKQDEKTRTLTITADKFRFGDADEEATYKTDTSKSPYQIDITSKGLGGKEEKSFGIYKIEDGKLYVCFIDADDSAKRPKEFKTTAGGREEIIIFRKK